MKSFIILSFIVNKKKTYFFAISAKQISRIISRKSNIIHLFNKNYTLIIYIVRIIYTVMESLRSEPLFARISSLIIKRNLDNDILIIHIS